MPNELATPSSKRRRRSSSARWPGSAASRRRVAGFLAKPHEAIEKLGPIDDPMIGVCVHWFYGPHTTDGVVGKDNPLLLASNFSGRWPGLVGLLNTGACLEMLGRRILARSGPTRPTGAPTTTFMERLERVVPHRAHRLRRGRDRLSRAGRRPPAQPPSARPRSRQIRKRRVLDPDARRHLDGHDQRLLRRRACCNRHGFTEHKVDQAWIIDRGERIDRQAHRRRASLREGQGRHLPLGRGRAPTTSTERATREQLRDYLAVLDLVGEFKADCLGWQYQLGLIPLRPPSDFAEGLFNSSLPARVERRHHRHARPRPIRATSCRWR